MKGDVVLFSELYLLPIDVAPASVDAATKSLRCSLAVVPLETMIEAENRALTDVSLTGTCNCLSLLILWLRVAFVLCLLSAINARHSFPIVALNLAFAGLTASACYFLEIKNSRGVLLAKLYLVTRVIAALVEFAYLGQTDALRTGIACGISLLCYLYLLRSKEVKSVYSGCKLENKLAP